MDQLARVLAVAVLWAALTGSAYAQSGIAGVVKDSSGALLPGVTVEAASPVLIEQVRSVVTNESGQYNIVDLRPGVYSVTFTLPGFAPARHQGVELPAMFTATVNAELRVGALEEAVLVVGSAPIVDVQRRRTAVGDEPAGSRHHPDRPQHLRAGSARGRGDDQPTRCRRLGGHAIDQRAGARLRR